MHHDDEDTFGSLSTGGPQPARTAAGSAASIARFDLSAELERLRGRVEYGSGDPTGSTLVKEADLRVVLIALRAGGRMHEHDTSGPISVQPIEGRIRFAAGSEQIELAPGEIVALKPGVSHHVEALEDAAFLLTVGRTKYHDVSVDHEPSAGR